MERLFSIVNKTYKLGNKVYKWADQHVSEVVGWNNETNKTNKTPPNVIRLERLKQENPLPIATEKNQSQIKFLDKEEIEQNHHNNSRDRQIEFYNIEKIETKIKGYKEYLKFLRYIHVINNHKFYTKEVKEALNKYNTTYTKNKKGKIEFTGLPVGVQDKEDYDRKVEIYRQLKKAYNEGILKKNSRGKIVIDYIALYQKFQEKLGSLDTGVKNEIANIKVAGNKKTLPKNPSEKMFGFFKRSGKYVSKKKIEELNESIEIGDYVELLNDRLKNYIALKDNLDKA